MQGTTYECAFMVVLPRNWYVDGGGGTAGSISIPVATVSFGTRYITVIQVEPVYHILFWM